MSNSRLRGTVFIYLGLVLLTWLTFRQVHEFEFVDYDDIDYVVENAHVTSGLTASSVRWAFTHAYEHTGGPLTWLSYMVNFEAAGLKPSAYHQTNLLFHAATVCLLFGAFASATGARWPSAFVAAVFAVHPLHVESVSWVAERKDVLSGFFMGVTLAAYVWYVRRGRWWRYAAVLVAFLAALLSKPVVVTLPILLLCLDVWPLRRTAGFRRAALEKIPLVAMAAVVTALTIASQRHLGAMSSIDAVPLIARLQNAVVSYGWYLGKTVWPTGLAAVYPLSLPISVPAVVVAAIVLLAVTWFVWRRAATEPFLQVGWLWYLIALVPVSGVFQTGAHARADRNMYVPLIGLAVMVAWSFERLGRDRPLQRRIIASAAVAVIVALALTARQQAAHWRNSETLFRRAVAVTEQNYIAETALATNLRRQGEIDGPVALYQQALASAPRYAAARGGLGEAFLAQGRVDAAVSELSRAAELDPTVPDFWVNLGTALSRSGRSAEAVTAFRRAVLLAPDRADVHSGLGAALAGTGDVDAAVRELRESIRLAPTFGDAYYNLGVLLARSGRSEEAVTWLQQATRLSPKSVAAYAELGGVLFQLARYDESSGALKTATELAPDSATLHSNLAAALFSAGRIDEAVTHSADAVRLAPNSPELQRNLDLMRAAQRRRGRQ